MHLATSKAETDLPTANRPWVTFISSRPSEILAWFSGIESFDYFGKRHCGLLLDMDVRTGDAFSGLTDSASKNQPARRPGNPG